MTKRQYSIDLIAQMAECDANYIRLLKLLPGLRRQSMDSDFSSREFSICDDSAVGEHSTISLQVLEVFKYTATLGISQSPRMDEMVAAPQMIVRVYHDANTAEVVSYQGHTNFLARYQTPNSNMYHQDEKRQVNSFLGEWLSLCLKAGRSLQTPPFACTA